MLQKPVNILMYLATCILLMHSMVPHHHSADEDGFALEQQETQEHSSLIGFLEDLFDIDLGDDHLENFQTSRSMDNLASVLFLPPGDPSFQAALPLFTLHQKFVIPRSLAFCHSPELAAFSLRGPPYSG